MISTREAMAEGHASPGLQAGVVETAFGKGTSPLQTETPAFRPGLTVAHVALGGNLGDVPAAFQIAVRRLAMTAGVRVDAVSRLYRTAPMCAEWVTQADATCAVAAAVSAACGVPDYWNAVVRLHTRLEPERLLACLLHLEALAGRVRTPAQRWASRTLDLDLVTYGDRVIRQPRLQVPHPRTHERPFVLLPLMDLDPRLMIAGWGLSVNELVGTHADPWAGIRQCVSDWLTPDWLTPVSPDGHSSQFDEMGRCWR